MIKKDGKMETKKLLEIKNIVLSENFEKCRNNKGILLDIKDIGQNRYIVKTSFYSISPLKRFINIIKYRKFIMDGILKDVKKIYRKIFPKKYYRYVVEFTYRNKSNGKKIVVWQEKIKISDQNILLNSRKLKKCVRPLHKWRLIKNNLCNGVLFVCPICYLGKF